MRSTTIAVMALALVGCGNELNQACERADECNLLRGVSADECTESAERRAEDLNDGESADLDTMLDMCLDWESCDAFEECLNDVSEFRPE